MDTQFNFTHNGKEYFYLNGYFNEAATFDGESLVFTSIEMNGDVTAESFKAATIEALSVKPTHSVPTKEEVDFGNEPMEF